MQQIIVSYNNRGGVAFNRDEDSFDFNPVVSFEKNIRKHSTINNTSTAVNIIKVLLRMLSLLYVLFSFGCTLFFFVSAARCMGKRFMTNYQRRNSNFISFMHAIGDSNSLPPSISYMLHFGTWRSLDFQNPQFFPKVFLENEQKRGWRSKFQLDIFHCCISPLFGLSNISLLPRTLYPLHRT